MTTVKYDFGGKTALVTGAGRGIGRAIVKALSESGAITYALSRTKEHLDSLITECPNVKAVCIDLTDWEAARKAVTDIGPIDLLVNNAGTNILESFLDVTPDSFDKIININLKTVINVSQVVAKSLIARRCPGAIVNISSQASMRAFQEHTVYCASKGGLDQLTRTMALELGPHNIRVNSVNPTVVLTDLGKETWSDPVRGGPMKARIPLGRFAEEEEVVKPVLFLLSNDASMINGAFLTVDGGFTV